MIYPSKELGRGKHSRQKGKKMQDPVAGKDLAFSRNSKCFHVTGWQGAWNEMCGWKESPTEFTGHCEHFLFYSQCNERAMEGFRVTWSGWSFKMICETISCLVSGVFYGGVSLGLATGYGSWELRWDVWEKNSSKSIMTTHHVLNHRHWSVLWNTSLKCYCDRTYWHLSLN